VNSDIDIVITWVNGDDSEWQNMRNQFIDYSDFNKNNVRYRNWDFLHFVFRGIEYFMPWVRKVYLVTYGHLPKWLNINSNKLKIVSHEEYIPSKYLPTFSANPIELNLHRISSLSEQFIYFNDDMFVTKATMADDFFVNGKPCDAAILNPYTSNKGGTGCINANNLEIVNEYFDSKDIIRNKGKWFNIKYGSKVTRNLVYSFYEYPIGFFEHHIPYSYLKSTFEEVWIKEFNNLDKTCSHKFRSKEDVNQWLFRYWQLMSGNFEPRHADFGIHIDLAKDFDIIRSLLFSKKYSMVCLNDNDKISDFKYRSQALNRLLGELYPYKSSFEI
jgi:hypothetical protein